MTDAGLKDLRRLKGLKRLYLSGTRITDAGLSELKEFKDLDILQLGSTQITDAGFDELQKSLPSPNRPLMVRRRVRGKMNPASAYVHLAAD